MRSSWIEAGPKFNDECSYKGQKREKTKHKTEGHVKIETENEVTTNQGMSRGSSSHQKLHEKHERMPLRASRRNQACRQLDFRCLASKIMKQYIFVILSHPGYGNLLQ